MAKYQNHCSSLDIIQYLSIFVKGMGTPLVMVTPLFALAFFGYGMGKRVVTYASSTPANTLLSPVQLFCAGAISGTVTSVVVAPVERIKCLLQVTIETQMNSRGSPGDKTN